MAGAAARRVKQERDSFAVAGSAGSIRSMCRFTKAVRWLRQVASAVQPPGWAFVETLRWDRGGIAGEVGVTDTHPLRVQRIREVREACAERARARSATMDDG